MFSTSAPRWMVARGIAILSSLALLSPLALADVNCLETRTAAHPEITQRLNVFQDTARTTRTQLDYYAATVRTGLPHQTTHAANLNHVRDNVNRLGRQLAAMETLNQQGSATQQAAVREVRPHLDQLADQVTVAINRVNEGSSGYRAHDFREMVNSMYLQADQIFNKVEAMDNLQRVCDRVFEVTRAGDDQV